MFVNCYIKQPDDRSKSPISQTRKESERRSPKGQVTALVLVDHSGGERQWVKCSVAYRGATLTPSNLVIQGSLHRHIILPSTPDDHLNRHIDSDLQARKEVERTRFGIYAGLSVNNSHLY